MPHILKSTPSRPVKFPPAVTGGEHKVSTGDNWWTLAATHGRSDPWDIIEFNFQTRDPYEVNWYMEMYLGCTKPAADGKNFRFDSSDSPGVVYIPPAKWTPSEDLRLRRMVAFALAGPVVSRIYVNYAGRTITGTSLASIANKVLDGDIGVIVDPRLKSNQAEYDSGEDVFHLGFRQAASRTRKALIVHEAVHAVLDQKAVPDMTISESESLAYVVQSFYLREHALDPDAERLTDSNEFKDRVYELAWDMAATLSKGSQPSSLEWLALDHAVRRHPEYEDDAGTIADFDGI